MPRAEDEKPRGVRAAYDACFKQNLNAQLGERLGLPIQAELAVNYLPLTIDIGVILRDIAWSETRRILLGNLARLARPYIANMELIQISAFMNRTTPGGGTTSDFTWQ